MDKEQIYYKVKHFVPWVVGYYKKSGLLPLPKDERDFKIGSLFGLFPYTPKNQRLELKTLSVKDQNYFNTCVFNSITVLKEIDEGVILSVRSLVAYAKRQGLISGNGFSNLRDIQKCLNVWGIEEEKDCPDGYYSSNNDFDGYVNVSLDQTKANDHKSSTFWGNFSKDDILKLLDEGHGIHGSMLWFSGYNQSGGFVSPWLISKALGYQLGGHAIAIIGYDLNYLGKKVFIIQNSYDKTWGDNGKFYVEMDFMMKEINRMGFGAYVNLDIEKDTGAFLNQYDGKNVKGNSPAIFFIQKGVRKVYPNWATYLAYGGKYSGFIQLDESESKMLESIKLGDQMNITDPSCPGYQYIKGIQELDDKNHELMSTLINLSKQELGLA